MIDHSKSKNIFRAVEKYLFRHLEPESMATPTVQNCPNLFSEATLIPLSRTVILESSACLLEDTYVAGGSPGRGFDRQLAWCTNNLRNENISKVTKNICTRFITWLPPPGGVAVGGEMGGAVLR